MKKVLAIVFFVFNLFSIGAQNYGGGNGSILSEEYQDGKTINVKKVTDEKEIIDGREGRWLNIEYENIEGWVFEGYVDETFFWGYFEPEAIIDMFFKYGQP